MWLVIVGLLPVRPRLADVVATVRARPAPPSSPGEPVRHGSGGWVLRWVGSVAPLLARAGFPGARVRADLRVVEQPEMVLVAATVVSGLAGLLAPVLVSLPLAVVGVGWLPGWVWLATAALAAVVPAARVRERAGRRREELRRAVGAVLDLTAIALAGGAGVEQALHGAAQIGAGWAHERLRTTLDTAYTTHADPWSALARLGDMLGVEVLVELGAVLDLAGTEGARVRASLVAKAAALRAHAHSEQEAAGGGGDRADEPARRDVVRRLPGVHRLSRPRSSSDSLARTWSSARQARIRAAGANTTAYEKSAVSGPVSITGAAYCGRTSTP